MCIHIWCTCTVFRDLWREWVRILDIIILDLTDLPLYVSGQCLSIYLSILIFFRFLMYRLWKYRLVYSHNRAQDIGKCFYMILSIYVYIMNYSFCLQVQESSLLYIKESNMIMLSFSNFTSDVLSLTRLRDERGYFVI